MAAAARVNPGVFGSRWRELMGRICCRFGRVEPRRRAEELVRGLASGLPTKNCWTIGEHIGAARPDGLQHLLRKAVWDHDGVRDELRSYVVEHLGSAGGVLVVDETGDLKKVSTPSGWPANTPVPPVGSRIPRSRRI